MSHGNGHAREHHGGNRYHDNAMILHPGVVNPNYDPTNQYYTKPVSYEAWKLTKCKDVPADSDLSWQLSKAVLWKMSNEELHERLRTYKRKGGDPQVDKANLKSPHQRLQIEKLLLKKNEYEDPDFKWTLVMLKDKREERDSKPHWTRQTKTKHIEIILKKSRRPAAEGGRLLAIDTSKAGTTVISDLRLPDPVTGNSPFTGTEQTYAQRSNRNRPVLLPPLLVQQGHDQNGRRNSISQHELPIDDHVTVAVNGGHHHDGRPHDSHYDNQHRNYNHTGNHHDSHRRGRSGSRHRSSSRHPNPPHYDQPYPDNYDTHAHAPYPGYGGGGGAAGNRPYNRYDDSSESGRSSDISDPVVPDYSPPSTPGEDTGFPHGRDPRGIDYMQQGPRGGAGIGANAARPRGLPYPGYHGSNPMANIMPNRTVGNNPHARPGYATAGGAYGPGFPTAGGYAGAPSYAHAGGYHGAGGQRRGRSAVAHFDVDDLTPGMGGMNINGLNGRSGGGYYN